MKKLKVISWGLPLTLYINNEGEAAVVGFWAPLYFHVFARIERHHGSFKFMTYQGSYLKALWKYFTEDFDAKS